MIELPHNPQAGPPYDRTRADYVDPPQASKDALLYYLRMRHYFEELQRITAQLKAQTDVAEAEMQHVWRGYACAKAAPGVYAFREMGRFAVVVDPRVDYPAIVEIVK